jgi:hypothetical protein
VPKEVCNKDLSYCESPYAMPSLGLKPAEIEALVAFINKKLGVLESDQVVKKITCIRRFWSMMPP